MKEILIIEDDPSIGNLLEEALGREGYRTTRAYSGTEALFVLEHTKPALILLDLMLPGLSGEALLPKLDGIPVIVVSAKAGVDGKVSLLRAGAADYITKPFDIDELLARVAVQLRIAEHRTDASLIEVGELSLQPDALRASVGEVEVKLTRTEAAILKLLMLNAGQVVTRSVLLERIAADTPDCTEGSLKVHVSNLRKKLREADGQDRIEAIWGIGFRLRT